MGFGTTRLVVWLNASIPVPHLAFEFGTTPNLFFYMDYLPRVDLWTDLDYLQHYYESIGATHADLREQSDLSVFVSKSLYIRQLQSPAHICFTSSNREESIELIHNMAHEMCDRWLTWADARPDGMPSNNWLSRFGGVAWAWDARRQQYYLHNVVVEQPDLNVHHPEVQAALLEVGRFWLELGVDGCRFDVANYFMHDPSLPDNPVNPHPTRLENPYFRQFHQHDITQPENLAFVERIRKELFDPYPGTLGLAEILSAEELEVMAEWLWPESLSL